MYIHRYILDATAEISMTFGNWSKSNITQTLSILYFTIYTLGIVNKGFERRSADNQSVIIM